MLYCFCHLQLLPQRRLRVGRSLSPFFTLSVVLVEIAENIQAEV